MPQQRKQGSRRGGKKNAGSERERIPLFVAMSMGMVALALIAVIALSLGAASCGEPSRKTPGSPSVIPAGLPSPAPAAPADSTATRSVQVPSPGAASPNAGPGASGSGSSAPGTTAAPASYRPPIEGPKPPTRPKKTLIFVLDDAGHNLRDLKPFLDLPFPLTIAVLPGLPHSADAAAAIRAAGKELILHQPMEALGEADPGPAAIYLATPPVEARRILEANLDALPGVVGVNNHMGSAVTRDPVLMTAVLAVAKKRGIYYLDSLTAPDTATGTVAARESFRQWERDVFLDNSPDRASIIRYIEEGKKKAERGGPAIMIGHVWSSELASTLQDLYPQLVEEGFSLSTIARYMLEEADENTRD